VSAAVPVKPPAGVTVIVEVPLVPGEAMVIAELVSVKLGVTLGAVTAGRSFGLHLLTDAKDC
jgi:hypothetical protein